LIAKIQIKLEIKKNLARKIALQQKSPTIFGTLRLTLCINKYRKQHFYLGKKQ
jgi:hypothetical protein